MTLKRLFWILAALFVATFIALARVDAALHSAHAPQGIISFEFCGFVHSCTQVLQEWGVAGRSWAMLSLGLDYLFMLSYAGMLCLGLLLASKDLRPRTMALVRLIAVGAIVAGLADAAENYALIQIVTSGDAQIYGVLAGTFASVKFTLVAIALLAWMILGIRRLADGQS